MQEELNLKDIYVLVKKYFVRTVLLMMVGGTLSVAFAAFFIPPKYQSEVQLLVNQRTKEQSGQMFQYNEVQTNIQLINTYRDLILGNRVLTKVREELGDKLEDKRLKNSIKLTQSPNSQAFYVSVVRLSPEEAQDIAEVLIEVFDETIQEAYGKDTASVYVVSPPSYNPNKVSPSLSRFAMLGMIAGLFISVVVVVLTELLDHTVKDTQYLVDLGMLHLGDIYEMDAKSLNRNRLNNIKKK